VFFWRNEAEEGQANAESLGIRRFYIYVAAMVAMAMGAYGLGRVFTLVLRSAYDAIFGQSVLVPSVNDLWTSGLTEALAVGIVGGAVWVAHWLVFARRDTGSTLRQVYLYVFAILGGVVTALVSGGTILYTLIGSVLQVAPDMSLVAQYRILPGAFTGLLVGLALGGYHFAVARSEASTTEGESQGAQRFYGYVMTLVGLGTSAFAAGTLTYTALALISSSQREIIVGTDVWRGPVSAAITLIILGLPIWGYYWTKMQKRVDTYGVEERRALSRRLFIFLVLGVGVLVLLGSVSTLLYQVLRDFLDVGLNAGTARDVRVPLSIVVGTLVFLPYYWRVYMDDRRADPEEHLAPSERPRRKQVSVLVARNDSEFLNALEDSLGYRVTRLHWSDADAAQQSLDATQAQAVAERVAQSAGARVIIVPMQDGLRVLSYE
jgi:hypothetical protein